MTLFTDAFDAVAATITEAVADLKRGTTTVADVLCSGVDRMRTQDEYGRIIGLSASVVYKSSAEPSAKPINEGDLVTLDFDDDRPNETARVMGRKESGGVVRLILQSEFD